MTKRTLTRGPNDCGRIGQTLWGLGTPLDKKTSLHPMTKIPSKFEHYCTFFVEIAVEGRHF